MKKGYKKITLYCPKTGAPAAISAAQAAHITGRTLRTAQRWASEGCTDEAARRLLELHTFGWLPWAQWDGWRIRGGTLFDARAHQSYWWDADRLSAWWIQVQQLQHYRREYERLSGKQAPKLVPIMTQQKRPA